MEENKKKELIKNDNLGKLIGTVGGDFPYISINDYPFSERELRYFEINTQGWIPEIMVNVKINHGIFLNRHFPKDGDLISVFVRSFNSLFKPIKCDFFITKVLTGLSSDNEGSIMSYTFFGTLNIPNLYSDVSMCIKDKTSMEALIEIANKLGLGFASNETSTDDKMSWRSSKNNLATFMQEIAQHSYKDENSWFDLWIDYYYNINFVNLNKNYSIPDDFEVFEGIVRGGFNTDYDGSETQIQKAKNILTNSPETKPSSQFFGRFEITNNSGNINNTLCYNENIYLYDKNLNDIVDFKISPFKTNGSEKSKVVMLGRTGEDFYKDNLRNVWMGFQFSGENRNVHNFWKLSFIQNLYNKQEVEKLTVTCEVPTANLNLYKGMVVPVIFIIQDDPIGAKVAGSKDDGAKKAGATINRFLSGNYTIQGIGITWKNTTEEGAQSAGGVFSQSIKLGRREWTMPNSPKHIYNDDPLSWASEYPY